MRLICGLHNIPKDFKPCVATIGNFDGVHLGHQAMIDYVIEKAQNKNMPSLLITFEPSPIEFFKGGAALARLTRFREKIEILRQTSLDYVLVLRFNDWLSSLSAEDFVLKVLLEKAHVKCLIIGDDFCFGAHRKGDIHLLERMSNLNDFSVKAMPTFLMSARRVSSTMARQALAAGDLEMARKVLGRQYSLSGRVRHGDKRGRTIGFPTANIFLHRDKSPVLGVYAVQMRGIDDQPINGVANVGTRPTVDGSRILLEVFLFDFNRDIYGRHVHVDMLHKLRDEKRYDSFEALKSQIDQDVEAAKAYFESNNK